MAGKPPKHHLVCGEIRIFWGGACISELEGQICQIYLSFIVEKIHIWCRSYKIIWCFKTMKVLTESLERLISASGRKREYYHSGVFVFPRKTDFFLKMFFLSGKNGFNVCLSLKLISLLKKCICLITSLFFLRQKVCKISLQHTKDVKLLPGTYLANSFVNRGKKCTFQ